MRLSAFIDGLNILRPYYNNPNGYHIEAEHDRFYCYETDKPLTPEDVKKMRDLGWFQPEDGIDPDGGEYNPEDGWSAFT